MAEETKTKTIDEQLSAIRERLCALEVVHTRYQGPKGPKGDQGDPARQVVTAKIRRNSTPCGKSETSFGRNSTSFVNLSAKSTTNCWPPHMKKSPACNSRHK